MAADASFDLSPSGSLVCSLLLPPSEQTFATFAAEIASARFSAARLAVASVASFLAAAVASALKKMERFCHWLALSLQFLAVPLVLL